MTRTPDASWANASAIRSAIAAASSWTAIATDIVGCGPVGLGCHGATRARIATTIGYPR